MKHHIQAISAIMRGELPGKPINNDEQEDEIYNLDVFEVLWNLCGLCWGMESDSRPNASQLVAHITSIIDECEPDD